MQISKIWRKKSNNLKKCRKWNKISKYREKTENQKNVDFISPSFSNNAGIAGGRGDGHILGGISFNLRRGLSRILHMVPYGWRMVSWKCAFFGGFLSGTPRAVRPPSRIFRGAHRPQRSGGRDWMRLGGQIKTTLHLEIINCKNIQKSVTNTDIRKIRSLSRQFIKWQATRYTK